jgi:hypothetical protein
MGLRFTRRVRIAPFARLNLSKSGASISVGRKGFWLTAGPRGRRIDSPFAFDHCGDKSGPEPFRSGVDLAKVVPAICYVCSDIGASACHGR